MTTEPGQAREAIEEIAATWIARRGEAWTRTDEAALNAWLAESTHHRVAYFRLDAVWERAGRLQPVSRFTRLWPVAIAASIVMLAAGIVFLRESGAFLGPAVPIIPMAQRIDTAAEETAATAAPAATTAPAAPAAVNVPASQSAFRQRYGTLIGASRVVSLPDGSRITLDTDTELRVTMDARSRTVRLDRGQAFFEVAHDVKRPFVVHTDRLSVTAVGTAFMVRSEAADARVVVAEGTVRLNDDHLLSAGGIARLQDDAVQIQQATVTEVERNLSWRSGVLTFRHAPLTEAIAEMNRYAPRKIIILDPAIGSLGLGGVFRTDEVESFVRLLERTFPIDATLHPDRIELTARSSP